MGRKVRLDRRLVDLGLAPARQRAQELIEAGDVLVDGVPVIRPATQVDLDRPIALRSAEHVWVGRGARKLLSVLDAFGMEVEGHVCADFGASTGGFTEVLLHRGAARVYAIDVGVGLLHERLRADPRVVALEGVNARHLESLPEPVTRVVGDLSFISITKVLPAFGRVCAPGAEAVVLVKPQFEVGRAQVGGGGRVRSEGARADAITAVRIATEALGFDVLAGQDSGVAGARSGNVEHFLHLRWRGSGARAVARPQDDP